MSNDPYGVQGQSLLRVLLVCAVLFPVVVIGYMILVVGAGKAAGLGEDGMGVLLVLASFLPIALFVAWV